MHTSVFLDGYPIKGFHVHKKLQSLNKGHNHCTIKYDSLKINYKSSFTLRFNTFHGGQAAVARLPRLVWIIWMGISGQGSLSVWFVGRLFVAAQWGIVSVITGARFVWFSVWSAQVEPVDVWGVVEERGSLGEGWHPGVLARPDGRPRRADLRHLHVGVLGHAAVRLPVRLQPWRRDVLPLALRALVRTLVGVKAPVQLEMHKLRELSGAQLAVERFLAAVQAHVRLQVWRGAEAFTTNLRRKKIHRQGLAQEWGSWPMCWSFC